MSEERGPSTGHKKRAAWLWVITVVLVIGGCIGLRYYQVYNSPENIASRQNEQVLQLLRANIRLNDSYRAKGYLSAEEDAELQRVIEQAKQLCEDTLYGSSIYCSAFLCAKDFTLPDLHPERTPTEFDYSGITDDNYAHILSSILHTYDIVRELNDQTAIGEYRRKLRELQKDARASDHIKRQIEQILARP